MRSVYPVWNSIVTAAERDEWFGTDWEGDTFAEPTMDDFDPLVPAGTIRDLVADLRLDTFDGIEILIASPEDVEYVYRHPRIDVLIIIAEPIKVFGPLSADGVRRQVVVETVHQKE